MAALASWDSAIWRYARRAHAIYGITTLVEQLFGHLSPQPVGDDDAHDLVGAFEDLVHPDVAHIALDREILQIAIVAKHPVGNAAHDRRSLV